MFGKLQELCIMIKCYGIPRITFNLRVMWKLIGFYNKNVENRLINLNLLNGMRV